ncbi:MAG: flagellar type III secretion system pore protein FliP [Oscillospiraceae bacterium]|nr:flagellar type III secretion system pore protein FliP [Oscillospiraceae bacterium]
MNRFVLIRCATLLLLVIVFAAFLGIPASAAVDGVFPGALDAPDALGGGPGTMDANLDNPNVSIQINGEGSDTVRIVLLLTVLTVLPSILLMMTCFTRIVIVFSLMRNALGLQQTPPNQVVIGLALFLTFFIMNPVITEINENAYQPFSEAEISSAEFLDRAKVPVRDFMLRQTRNDDINLFLSLADRPRPAPGAIDEYTMDVVVSAFITSEIKRAFTIGFFLFIPFLLIDMVVASALMSMGMMMLPPAMISLPFKILLFITVDGWGLLIRTIVASYNL